MNSEERYQDSKKVTLFTLITNFILSIIKIIIGGLFFSQAVLADGIHSVSDVISTTAVWIAISISRKPADNDHPYGHGKAEFIAAKLIGIILFFTGLLLIKESLISIWSENLKPPRRITVWVALLSILTKELMYQYTYRKGQKLNNKALVADAHHHRSDAISSIAALFGVLGARVGYPILDPIAGLIVALFILKMGFEIFSEAVDDLMDKVDYKLYDEISSLVKEDQGVMELSDLKLRAHGPDIFIDLRIIVNDDISVVKGHRIANRVETKIKEEIDNIKEVLIHVDPESSHQLKRPS